MVRAVSAAAFLTLALAACGAPRPAVGPPGDAVVTGGLSLSVESSSYRRGEAIPLTLANTGATTYEGGVLGCATTERWADGAWATAEDDQRACILMLVQLAPSATMEGEVALDLPPGIYRFVHTLSPAGGGEAVTVATRAFRLGTGRSP